MNRRDFIGFLALFSLTHKAQQNPKHPVNSDLCGVISEIKCAPGQRQNLIEILTSAVPDSAECFSFIIAKDTSDEDAIWISEVWRTPRATWPALEQSGLEKILKRAAPLIKEVSNRAYTTPENGSLFLSKRLDAVTFM